MAKIKILFVDLDNEYLDRISDYFALYHGDEFETAVFSDEKSFQDYVSKNKSHCILASNAFFKEELVTSLNSALRLIKLDDGSESGDLEIEHTDTAKYQNIENLIKTIKSVVADVLNIKFSESGNAINTVYVFDTACGGCGTTAVSIAMGERFASKGKSVLYVNFENVGDITSFVPDATGKGLSDLIYQCKSGKGSFDMKFESVVKKTETGLNYILPCSRCIDMSGLSSGDIKNLIGKIKDLGRYDYIIIDKTYGMNAMDDAFVSEADRVLYISDGSDNSNGKIMKVLQSYELKDKKNGTDDIKKVSILYNKFHNNNSKMLELENVDIIAGFPYVESRDDKKILGELSSKSSMDKLF